MASILQDVWGNIRPREKSKEKSVMLRVISMTLIECSQDHNLKGINN